MQNAIALLGRPLIGFIAAAGAFAATPALAQSWTYQPTERGGFASSCAPGRSGTVCAVVYCSPRGDLNVGLAGWADGPNGAEAASSEAFLSVDGTGIRAPINRTNSTVGGGVLWRADLDARTAARAIDSLKRGNRAVFEAGPDRRLFEFGLGGSARTIGQVEARCDGVAAALAAPTPAGDVIERDVRPAVEGRDDDDRYAALDDRRYDERTVVRGGFDDGIDAGDRLEALDRDVYERAYPAQRGERDRFERWGERDFGWEPIGAARIGKRGDRAIFRPGPDTGRVQALRLDVSLNDLFLRELVVVYGNGREDLIRLPAEWRRGESTGPIELRARPGRGRFIDAILIDAATIGRGPRARVDLYALPAG